MDESVACHEPGPEHSTCRDAVLLADSDSLDALCRPGEEVTEERSVLPFNVSERHWIAGYF